MASKVVVLTLFLLRLMIRFSASRLALAAYATSAQEGQRKPGNNKQIALNLENKQTWMTGLIK